MAKKKYLCVLLWLAFAMGAKAKTADSSILTINFRNVVGKDSLELGRQYTNPHGEPFSVTNFKYYLFDFCLIEKQSGKKVPLTVDYFLIEERKPESKSLNLTVPKGNFSGVSFSIGVDSIQNVSGVQEGALDPVNGMFWTWNTGYIMAKLEGKSSLSKAPFTNITYHIGGFKTGENVLRKVRLPLQDFTINKQHCILDIDANINAWFDGVHEVKIAEHAFFMNPGPVAVQIADNYAKMFSVRSWHNFEGD